MEEQKLNELKKMSAENFQEYFDEKGRLLLQGKDVDLQKLSEQMEAAVSFIEKKVEEFTNAGIEFPMEYVKNAAVNYVKALNEQDDYLLADNLIFEWKEIFQVVKEVVDELGQK